MFDEFAPPGYMTSKGHDVTITEAGELILHRGAKVAKARMSRHQWQLLLAALIRLEVNPNQRGPILLVVDNLHLLSIKRDRLGLLVTIGGTDPRNPSRIDPSAVGISLRRGEATDFLEACRRRVHPSNPTD